MRETVKKLKEFVVDLIRNEPSWVLDRSKTKNIIAIRIHALSSDEAKLETRNFNFTVGDLQSLMRNRDPSLNLSEAVQTKKADDEVRESLVGGDGIRANKKTSLVRGRNSITTAAEGRSDHLVSDCTEEGTSFLARCEFNGAFVDELSIRNNALLEEEDFICSMCVPSTAVIEKWFWDG